MGHERAIGVQLPVRDRKRLRDAVEALGEREVLRRLRISRLTFARAVGGLTMYRGSVVLIQQGLDLLDDSSASGPRGAA